MKPSEALSSNRAAIRQVVESHRARNARVFGSVLHGLDTESGDLDLLIDPTPETTLLDIGAIRHELGQLLGVPVCGVFKLMRRCRHNCDTATRHRKIESRNSTASIDRG